MFGIYTDKRICLIAFLTLIYITVRSAIDTHVHCCIVWSVEVHTCYLSLKDYFNNDSSQSELFNHLLARGMECTYFDFGGRDLLCCC